jgi:hypothetical protein
MVLANNEKQTVSWVPVTSLAVGLLFVLMGMFTQWGMSRVPDGIPEGTGRTVWLFYLLGIIFCGRALWGVRWFAKAGGMLAARSFFKQQVLQPEQCVAVYRSGSILPGSNSSFLMLVEFKTNQENGQKTPFKTFLCGWVFGLNQARGYARQLEHSFGIGLEPKLADTSAPPATDTIKKAIIIIPLAVIAMLLVKLFILYIKK